MLKNIMVIIATFILTACGSAMPKQAQTHQEFYHPPTMNIPNNTPKSQCVYKTVVTDADKIQVHEQFKKLRDAIYQNWKPPTSANEVGYARFEISPTCQITNIYVDSKDPAFKQSLITALQNTKIDGLEYQAFKNNSMAFKAH